MLIYAATAKTLFGIVIGTALSTDVLRQELPLQVEDRGDAWLVMGTPHTNEKRRVRFSRYVMFFDKRSAEVLGVEHTGRRVPTEDEKAYWATIMTPEQYENVFKPPSHFEPNGIHELWHAIYGGIVTTPTAAAEYAAVLMRTKPAWSHVTPSDLVATERDKVWHISCRHKGTDDLITLSKTTGKLLSGDL